ncbi:hypothetical protein L596_000873 [Steinernema carpocapsae]|uniref:Uncharacterized protein n=1 Tax=Steinernema carpocapsae TaxID=34508 RepID=A0A4U8ULV2_STECR|nr:hypothetical protein L596_000873 [Steinernema carpocapsae]
MIICDLLQLAKEHLATDLKCTGATIVEFLQHLGDYVVDVRTTPFDKRQMSNHYLRDLFFKHADLMKTCLCCHMLMSTS